MTLIIYIIHYALNNDTEISVVYSIHVYWQHSS